MKRVHSIAPVGLPLAMMAALFVWQSAVKASHTPRPQTGAASDKPAIFVSDFELDVLPANRERSASTATPPGAAKPADEARKQAAHLVEQMRTDVVLAFQNAGYSAVRLHSGDARPDHGVLIRGLFAEVDKENHWRRAVIRTASDSGKMQVLVSVVNLSKPDQALYEIANVPGNGNKPGAVITLSPYVPLAKFDFDKDAPEEAFQKTAARIVKDLIALLNANPGAVSP